MPPNTAKVSILVTAKNAASGAINEVKSSVDGLKGSAEKLVGGLGVLGLSLGAGGLAGWLVKVNKEYGSLLTQLETFEGSAAGARAVFTDLARFAATTPFQITETVRAYTTLRTAGIVPTMESMRLFGDQAAAFGRRIDEFAVAVRSATNGEFEPLKGFGVQMHVFGDQATATFQGVKTTIGRDAGSIVHYLEDIAKAHFAGGMERESRTLGGALSNLEDAAESAGRAVGDTGLTGDVTHAVQALTEFITVTDGGASALDRWYERLKANLSVLPTYINAVGQFVNLVDPTAPGTFAERRANFQDAQAAFGSARDRARTLNGLRPGGIDLTFASGSSGAGPFGGGPTDFGFGGFGSYAPPAAAGLAASGRSSVLGDGKYTSPTEARRKAREAAAKAKAAHKAMLDDLTENAALTAELLELAGEDVPGAGRPMDYAIRALDQQVRLDEAVRTLTDPGDRVKVLRAGDRLRKALRHNGVGPNGPPPPIYTPLDTVDPNQGLTSQLAGGNDARQAAAGAGMAANLGQSAARLDHIGLTVAMIGDGFTRATENAKSLTEVVGDAAVGTFEAFGGAVEGAFAALIDGSHAAGGAFAAAMLGALGQVAHGFGDFFMQRAAGEIAMAISNPLTAGQHVASAAKFTGAAAGMYAVAGSLSGAARVASGYGGGGGRGGAYGATNTLGSEDRRGEATLVIEGGLLDLSDPRQELAFKKALEALSGRRVTINGSRLGAG